MGLYPLADTHDDMSFFGTPGAVGIERGPKPVGVGRPGFGVTKRLFIPLPEGVPTIFALLAHAPVGADIGLVAYVEVGDTAEDGEIAAL